MQHQLLCTKQNYFILLIQVDQFSLHSLISCTPCLKNWTFSMILWNSFTKPERLSMISDR